MKNKLMIGTIAGILLLSISVWALAQQHQGQALANRFVCSAPGGPDPEECITAFKQEPASSLCEENQQVHLVGCSNWAINGQSQVCVGPLGAGLWCECKYTCTAKK